jgi:hypothetical protein
MILGIATIPAISCPFPENRAAAVYRRTGDC